MNTCPWNFTPTCPSLDNPSYLRIETLRIHNTIRIKCLRAKVPPAWQLEEIFCTLHKSCLHQFLPGWPQESCWEIKRILREAEVTVLWNWPEVCSSLGTVTPHFSTGVINTDLKSIFCIIPINQEGQTSSKAVWVYRNWGEEGQIYLCVWWMDCCKCIFNRILWWLIMFFLLFHRVMAPWCGARITSSAPR